MKKAIIALIAVLLIHCCVSAQHIPDNNFADAIRKKYSTCIDGDNNLLPPAKNLETLEVQHSNISSIEGIEGFTSLTRLDFRYNADIKSLPVLPASIKKLFIGYTGLNTLKALPPALELLELNECPLTSLPDLPSSLQILLCEKSGLTSLPQLPEGLTDLYVNYSPITGLPNIPKSLNVLYIFSTKITYLPPFPDGLSYFKISDGMVDCIPSNNPQLWIADINGNRIKTTLCKGYSNSTEAKAEKKEIKEKCISGNCTNWIGTYVVDGPNGHFTYKGSFKDGIQNGKGILTSSDGTVFNGEWKKGLVEGNGTMLFKNGKRSTGIWKQGTLWIGTGFFSYGDNDTYYGGVKENKPDGQGTRSYPNGKKFIGTFSKAQPMDGKGYILLDGIGYEGTIVNGKYSGPGTYTDASGQIFTGNFVNGDLTGYGKLTAPAGSHYEGNFKNGKFDGYGQMTYDKGSVYKGNWANGKRNGSGSSYANGNLDYNGEWNDGEMADPKKSVSYKTRLWERSKEFFRRVTFKGLMKTSLDQPDVHIKDEYHLNNDYTLYGTNESTIEIDGTKYSIKLNTTGTFDPENFNIHMDDASIIRRDDLPDGRTWSSGGSIDGTLYKDQAHPFYYVIKGTDEHGNKFEETDYQ